MEYWQRLLKLQGHYAGKLDADYGPKTRAAVAAAGFEGTDGKKICPSEAAAIQLWMTTFMD